MRLSSRITGSTTIYKGIPSQDLKYIVNVSLYLTSKTSNSHQILLILPYKVHLKSSPCSIILLLFDID